MTSHAKPHGAVTMWVVWVNKWLVTCLGLLVEIISVYFIVDKTLQLAVLQWWLLQLRETEASFVFINNCNVTEDFWVLQQQVNIHRLQKDWFLISKKKNQNQYSKGD